jgi:hypothetical protein
MFTASLNRLECPRLTDSREGRPEHRELVAFELVSFELLDEPSGSLVDLVP